MKPDEIFDSMREFNKKFPSKIYICSACAQLTPNPNICIHCGAQGNNFFNYTYKIQGEQPQTIFKPIELIIKGQNNEN